MGFSLPDERRKIFRKGKKLEIHVRSLNVTSEPATYSYTPYGVTTTSTSVSGSDRLNPFKYTSRQELAVGGDSGTRPNLYHYRSRAYLPEIAHFAQVDGFPGFMFHPASINKYMYVEGWPINATDPYGLISATEIAGIIGIIAAGIKAIRELGQIFGEASNTWNDCRNKGGGRLKCAWSVIKCLFNRDKCVKEGGGGSKPGPKPGPPDTRDPVPTRV